LKSAVLIDLMVAKKEIPADRADGGKGMLGRIANMLLAMRGYCEG